MELEEGWEEQLAIQDQVSRITARLLALQTDGPQGAEQLAELSMLRREDQRLRERYKDIADEIEPAKIARALPLMIADWQAATTALTALVKDGDDYQAIASRMAEALDWISELQGLRVYFSDFAQRLTKPAA